MSDKPTAEEIARWDRMFGAAGFNAAWALIDQNDRSDDDDLAMLLSAAASRWHWGRVGGAEEVATGDWQVAHVLCALGEGSLALRFAQRNLSIARAEQWAGWRLASAHEGMARACAVLGDGPGRDEHVTAAEAGLREEPDAEERDVIAAQLASVPVVG